MESGKMSLETPQRPGAGPPLARRDPAGPVATVATRYERCHPNDTFEDLRNRARFSKEDRRLLEDWLAAFGAAGEGDQSPVPRSRDRLDRLPIVATVAQESIEVEAAAIASGLGLDAAEVPALIRGGEITSICETGIGDDEGRHRLTFFFRNARLSLVVDTSGRLLERGTINFGDRTLPPELRRPLR